jgi:WD40-like Beta Propeller Repeat
VKHTQLAPSPSRSVLARLGGMLGLLLTVAAMLAVPASASYEQVATFKDGNLNQASGFAVNVSGFGGVPPGSLYVASAASETKPGSVVINLIQRYSAKGEFLGQWGIGSNDKTRGVAVDQTTGNVYIEIDRDRTVGKTEVVQVYDADGSQLIAGFGEMSSLFESIDEGPEKIHNVWRSGIAVDDSGVVYVSDRESGGKFESRVMVFKPQSPGDYEHYGYAGRANDIAASQGGANYEPEALALDDAGNLYTANSEAIYQFDSSDPGGAPICEYKQPTGGIRSMTVDPTSGEVFFFYDKDRKFHQLAPCNAQGKFVERASFALTPKPGGLFLSAAAFNPALVWEPSRPAGALYAADPLGANEENEPLGYIFAPAEVRDPVVESESVSKVTSSTATLRAQINPNGSPTRYAFQYITDAAYQENEPAERFAGATEAPFGGALLGSGQDPLDAGVSLLGLTPETEYHYRAIATSNCDPDDEAKVCEAIGAGDAFRTYPTEAPGLPDNRAWELVSPVQKQGGEVIPADPISSSCPVECKPGSAVAAHYPAQSTPDGETVVYEGQPFSSTEGAAQFNQYLARRTPTGWQTTNLSPALMGARNTEGFKGFDAGLNRTVIVQNPPTLSADAPSEFPNLYAQDTANPSALSPLLGFAPPNRTPGAGGSETLRLTFAGASADFSQLFFEANDALTEETPFAPEAVDGGASKNNLYESVNGELRLVNVLPGNAETVPGAVFGSGELLVPFNGTSHSNFSNAISDDGSRVFWSSEAGGLYVRIDGEETREIPSPGLCKASLPAGRVCFLTASVDGSKVLLSNGDLYDLETEETIDLTEGKGGFRGIVGQSEDLSHVYFVDTAVLTGEEENDHGAKAQAGQNNLYAWHEGVTTFVATLGPLDNEMTRSVPNSGGDWNPSPARRTAEASPDGRWLAFLSRVSLTGYDNSDPSCPFSDDLCWEAFLYDSATGELRCPSCNPSGARPLGVAHLGFIQQASSSFPQPRYLLNSGRLYFDTGDSLTPFDTNEGVEDVYQYEPQGVGSCKRAGGCVSLISAGHEPVDSNFFAVDASGKNVFFTTSDQLAIKDRDDLIDLYVAREGGGIPAETETSRSECQGESCQPAAVVPNDPTPGSSSFQGVGNLKQRRANARCSKGKVRKRGRCVKQQRKRSHGRAAKRNRGGAR